MRYYYYYYHIHMKTRKHDWMCKITGVNLKVFFISVAPIILNI